MLVIIIENEKEPIPLSSEHSKIQGVVVAERRFVGVSMLPMGVFI